MAESKLQRLDMQHHEMQHQKMQHQERIPEQIEKSLDTTPKSVVEVQLIAKPAADNFIEPLLIEPAEERNTVFPLPMEEVVIYDAYKHHRSTFWSTEEVDRSNDAKEFAALTADEQHYLSYTLAFFASSDELVGENLEDNFEKEIKQPSARKFYSFQKAIEDVHSEMYSLLIIEYIKDPVKRDHLLNAVTEIPCIKRKADWLRTYMSRDVSFVHRLVAFIAFEGCCFASSFASIFYFKTQHPGKLGGLVFSNELIARDEGLHADFGIALYNMFIKRKLTDDEIHEMIREIVAIERNFVTESLPCGMIGIDPMDMCHFVEYNADRILDKMGHPKIWKHRECPMKLMELINLQTKTNFFEKKSAEYSKSTVFDEGFEYDSDEDF